MSKKSSKKEVSQHKEMRAGGAQEREKGNTAVTDKILETTKKQDSLKRQSRI